MVMNSNGGLVHFSLEDRGKTSPLKKLNTAISIESPDLFRIRGVSCIDRGADGSRPPVPCEYWKQQTGGYVYTVEPVKKTANFARPTSVSADAPSTFKIPGVAINRRAMAGVEAACSPPPGHQPFRLPGAYMHGKAVRPTVDPAATSGQWQQTDLEIGQWGHATREFQEAISKLRRQRGDGVAERVEPSPTPQERSAPPSEHVHNSDHVGGVKEGAQYRSVIHKEGTRVGRAATDKNNEEPAAPIREVVAEGGRGRQRGQVVVHAQGSSKNSGNDPRKRRVSKAEMFQSRLEGNRGPQNRRESITLFKRILRDCPPPNNSAELGDLAAVSSSTDKRAAAAAAAVRDVLAVREESHTNLGGLMSVDEGSYMLAPEGDRSKVSLGVKSHRGRRQQQRLESVGVVRVSTRE